MAQERRRPSPSSNPPFTGFRSRRGSLSSLHSHGTVDKQALSQALDDIHTSASRSGTLTSFSDFEGRGNNGRGAGPKELVTGGISGLYTRLKQSVGAGTSPTSDRPASRGSLGYADTASVKSSTSAAFKSIFEDKAKAEPTTATTATATTSPATVTATTTAATAATAPAPLPIFPQKAPVSSHVSRNSVSFTAESSSLGSLKSPASSFFVAEDAQDSELQASMRPPPKPLSRPASRDVTAAALSRLQNMSGGLSQHDQGNASKRSSFQSTAFPHDNALFEDDEPAHSYSPSPGATITSQQPLDQATSFHASVLDKTSRRRSQHAYTSELSPGSTDPSASISTPRSQAPLGKSANDRPPLRVTPSHLPNMPSSRLSSNDDAGTSTVNSQLTTPLGTPLVASPNYNVGLQAKRQPLPKHWIEANARNAVVPSHIKRRVLDKEFWMKDENARDCFHCGNAFSTFRRKHHCRSCGSIFDSQCTVLVPGKPFDQPGKIRLCRPCESMIYGSDDDSTVFTDDDELRSPQVAFAEDVDLNQTALATPSIGIPVSRRNRENKRRSAVIEFDQPVLARPSSSRSLKSLTGRPKSNHKRRPSRHQYMRTLKYTPEERGPFYQDAADVSTGVLTSMNNDAFIDPELADYMSDEYSEDDQSFFGSTPNARLEVLSPIESGEKAGLTTLLASAVKKGRSRRGDRSIAGQSIGKDSEGMHIGRHTPRHSRKRNPSVTSLVHGRPSPRRSRSTNLLKALDGGYGEPGAMSPTVFENSTPPSIGSSQIKCSSAMHGSNAPPVELNNASLQHVQKLLAQLLKDSRIPHRRKWQKALMPILLQCTDDVDPDVQNGDDMDIRNYIKIKKIPGGLPGDTAYVSGIVFSKNIALKDMPRKWTRPRIIIITFPIEYQRKQNFYVMDNLIAQEREWIRNLVGRIVALNPNVLLAERNVSGSALQLLQEAGVTVVSNIKESVLAAVARVTKTVLIKTQDKLSMDPDLLGECATFEIKTYVHGGRKKSYAWMSGCDPDLGCTIILRGAAMETLRSIKRITEFMCYVVYNLKLETCLMRDEFVLIPSSTVSTDSPDPVTQIKSLFQLNSEAVSPTPRAEKPDPFDTTYVASYGDAEATYAAAQVNSLNHLVEATIHEKDGSKHSSKKDERLDDEPMPSEYRELIETARSRLLSSSPFVKFTEPYLLVRAQEQERTVEQTKRLRDYYDASCHENKGFDHEVKGSDDFELVVPEMLRQPSPKEQPEIVRKFIRDMYDAQYHMAVREYDIRKRQWESFFTSSGHDPFNPFSHQNIWVLHSIVSSVTSVPCFGPEVFGLGFYAGFGSSDDKLEEDCTLGQYIEDVCSGASSTCKVCSRKMTDHHRQYVHGHGQLSVSVKRYPSKYPGLRNTIFMWSACKICHQETTWMPMSDSSWKYSFGKYLELSFWSTPLKPRAGVCPHDIHKDFIRCFGYNGLAVRVQYDPVELYDVIVPRTTITWDVSAGLEMKNQLFTQFQSKLDAFIASVKARLHSINLSTVAPEVSADATAVVEKLMQRAEDDHAELLDKLRQKYMLSQFYEIVPMNRAVRMMDEKAIAWDEAFTDFERNYFPSENDIRRLATLQLKKLFLDRGEPDDQHAQSGSDVDEGMEMQDRTPGSTMKLTDEELQSEKAQNMLTSVFEEHAHSVPTHTESPMSAVEDMNMLSRQLSASEAEQAVEREDVKHLDLAVPTIEKTDADNADALGEEAQETMEGDENTAPAFTAVEPKPLNSTILERIEQMRSAAAASPGGDNYPESRIPRLAGLKLRGTTTPPLNRTQSQPSHLSRRNTDLALDTPPLEYLASSEHSGTVTPTARNVPNKDLAKSIEQRLADRLGAGRKAQASLIPRSVPTKPVDNITKVSALAKHFEQLSREFERERLRERRQRAARSRQVRANPVGSSRPVVEVYTDAALAVGEKPTDRIPLSDNPLAESSQEAVENIPSSDDQQQASKLVDEGDSTDHYITDTDVGGSTLGAQTDTEAEDNEAVPPSDTRSRDMSDPLSGMSSSQVLSPASPHDLDPNLDLTLPRHEKSSLMRVLTSFWSERSASGWLPLEYPLLPTEHVFEDSDIIVREDEPASIIALALSSPDYTSKVDAFRRKPNGGRNFGHNHTNSESSFSFPAQVSSTGEYTAQAAIEASLISQTGTHMKYSFAHGSVRATCKIFYAESFDALRRKCDVSGRFVESLSRCAKWDSKGGKTKSLFLKTLDDRFVIKSLQEVEMRAFTKFAPDYFAFMSHTLFHGVPSVIAKMFGLFQVNIKNPATGLEFSSYLLVMENLFYSRNPTRRFDLKGSMRNRKIESTGQPDEVLLDENLVETIFETPLFVREHARKLLRAGVWNDTMWLCKQNVMDYSLMAGFDDSKKELVVGIIGTYNLLTFLLSFFFRLSLFALPISSTC